jgi:hypothetical protein
VQASNAELSLIEIGVSDNGTEVLWGETTPRGIRIASVPVFAFDISQGTLVAASPAGNRLRFERVLVPSGGSTVRCYVAKQLKASEVYHTRLVTAFRAAAVDLGPATFFDPEIVALHIEKRTEMRRAAEVLDGLTRQGILRFWERADPGPSQHVDEAGGSVDRPWELVHPLPVKGEPTDLAFS